MKQILHFFLLNLTLALASSTLFAKTWTVQVGPATTNTFSPSSLPITKGDTVLWQWVSGLHTTTSDANSAEQWNADIVPASMTFSRRFATSGTFNYHCTPHQGSGMTGSITVSNPINVPLDAPVANYILRQNYPNPLGCCVAGGYLTTMILYDLPSTQHVTLKIYDALGSVIATLVNSREEEGEHHVMFNGAGFPQGFYIYELRGENFLERKKMELMN